MLACRERFYAEQPVELHVGHGGVRRQRRRTAGPKAHVFMAPFTHETRAAKNRQACRRRNVIERMFGRLKNWKRIATRYDRLAINYLAAIALVATLAQSLG